jgi:hypothetical protein
MAQRERGRAPGEKELPGIAKIWVLTYVFNHPEGVKLYGVHRHLLKEFDLDDKKPVKKHLKDLAEYGYLREVESTVRDDSTYYPTSDRKHFEELWLDETRIWVNAGFKEVSDFINTKHVSEFIETDIVPAFIDIPVSKTSDGNQPFEGNELYANLPHNEHYRRDPEFKHVCIWAFKHCPLLITHVFKPNKQVLLCLAMILQRSLNLPNVKRSRHLVIELSPTELSQNFALIAGYIRKDWKDIRFSSGTISKELICILTMIVCFYIYLERDKDRALAELYYSDKTYLALWGQYKTIMEELSRDNPEILMDAMKIVFIISLTDELFNKNKPRKIPPNAF